MNKCQNCDWHGPDSELGRAFEDIPDLHERVAPSEPTPSGECPECGALCQAVGMFHEDAIIEYAAIIREASHEHGAPNFATSVIDGGWDPDHLRERAQEWRNGEFVPADFADRLDTLAAVVEGLRAEGLVM